MVVDWLDLKGVARVLGRKPSSYLKALIFASGQFEARRVLIPNHRNPNSWKWEFRPIEGTWDDFEGGEK